jgi:hypothetical protein
MKKILGSICLVVGFCIVFGACSKSDTYADKVKKERKAIKRFINEQNIVVLKSYPANGEFKENEYFLDSESGVYIHVIDSGNGNRAIADNRAEVSVRFWDAMALPEKKDTVTNDVGGVQPITFLYGRSGTYTSQNTNSFSYAYLSPGITIPLKYVGENAEVKLIVPFASGSTYQNQTWKAIYYGRLKYTKIIN